MTGHYPQMPAPPANPIAPLGAPNAASAAASPVAHTTPVGTPTPQRRDIQGDY